MRCKRTKFDNKEAIEVATKFLRMVILIECGPRIVYFGKVNGGEYDGNLLFYDREGRGRGEWMLIGGHRIWVTRPKADESEDAYRPDNAPCEVDTESSKKSLTILGSKDTLLQIRKGFRIEVVDDNVLLVDNFVINDGDMLYSCGVWALTCTEPNLGKGVRYGIPLGDGSEWDSFSVVMFRRWAGHTSPLNDPQITFTEDMLILTPKGVETKRMVEAPYGIFAMEVPSQKTTFIKKTTYYRERSSDYPRGCNLAFYVGPKNFMVEMESMSPEQSLKPKGELHHIEKWILTEKVIPVDNAKKLIESIT